jgi:hypothetical protein
MIYGYARVSTDDHSVDVQVRRFTRAEYKNVFCEHRLFAFLTTKPNDIVPPVHANAMPVTPTAATWYIWLEAHTPDALGPQRPLPSGPHIVATGQRSEEAFFKVKAHDECHFQHLLVFSMSAYLRALFPTCAYLEIEMPKTIERLRLLNSFFGCDI